MEAGHHQSGGGHYAKAGGLAVERTSNSQCIEGDFILPRLAADEQQQALVESAIE